MKIKLIFIACFFVLTASAQTAAEGETLFTAKQYAKARTVFETLLKRRPADALLNYKCARCCYELGETETAIRYFELAGTKYPLRDYYLGELYFDSYRFDQSVASYQTFLATLKPEDPKIGEVNAKIAKSEAGAKLLVKVEDIAIVDSVVVNKNDFLRFYKYSPELGTLTQKSVRLSNRKMVDLIRYTSQRGDRSCFSDTVHNQLDLFSSYKLLDGWTSPSSLSGQVNSRANENYPFVMLDGVTVYFASDGPASMGGYDIFVTRFTPNTNSYLPPENMGFPFNSTANDYMLVIDEQQKLGWFATDRNQAQGKVMIYTFVPNEQKNIIRSEDRDYVRNVAMLKSYRKAEIAQYPAASQSKTTSVSASDKQIEFVVNDSLVYTHTADFKSQDALKMWNELQKMTAELKKLKADLNEMRNEYGSTDNDGRKAELSTILLELEPKVPELDNAIRNQLLKIRKTELEKLAEKKE